MAGAAGRGFKVKHRSTQAASVKARYLATTVAVLSFLAVSVVEGQSALPSSPDQVRPLMVGASIPAAQLQTAEGESFDLGSAIAAKPAVLVFYRGGW